MSKIQCSRCAEYFSDDRRGADHIAGCRRYNGWSNYETWAVALWLDNERGTYEFWRDRAREASAENPPDQVGEPSRTAVLLVADELKAAHQEAAADRLESASDVFVDLINAALDDVDWVEIARHVLSE